MKRSLVLITLLLVVSLGASGAGRQEAPAATAPAPEEILVLPYEDRYPELAASKANINWRQFEGTTINIAMLQSVLMDWQVEMIPDFERLTGIRVQTEGYAENPLYQKVVLDLSSGAGHFDAMFVGPFFAPKFVQENWVANLGQFLNDPKLTDKTWYDYEDILASIRGAYTIGDYVAALPLDGVTHCLFYRKDLFDKYGLEVPKTMDDLEKVAAKLTMDTNNDGRIDLYGIGLRGAYMQVALPMFLYTYGGGYVDERFQPIVNSRATKAGMDKYVSLIKEYGPPGSANKNWTDVLEDFRGGNTAMIIDTTAWVNQLEDPAKSAIVGKVGAARVPGLSTSDGEPGWWSWSLAMNNDSRVKGATWLYMMWTTSKLQSLRFSLKRGVTGRTWVTKQPDYLDQVGKLNFGQWLDVYLHGMQNARPDFLVTQISGEPISEATEIMKTVGTEVTAVIAGQKTVDEAAASAQAAVQAVLRKAGY